MGANVAVKLDRLFTKKVIRMYKLLIVDDNKLQIKSLIYYLEQMDFVFDEIRTAEDGQEGFEIFKSFKPDIIITDVVMPGMDGIEFTRKVRHIDNKAKFIYISCHEDVRYIKEALENNVVSYLLKPIEPDRLKNSLEKIIDEIEYDKKYVSMNILLKESMDAYRTNLLYKLIYSRSIDTENLKNALLNLEFDEYKSFIVASVENMSSSGRFIDIYNLLNLTENSLFREVDGMAVAESENRIVVAFMGKTEDKCELTNRVIETVKKYYDMIDNEFNIRLNVGLSTVYESLVDFKLMLQEAYEAAENNSVFGDGEIGVYDAEQIGIPDFDIMEIKDALNEVLNVCTKEQVDLFAEMYFSAGVCLSSYNLRVLNAYIYSALRIILTERDITDTDIINNLGEIWNEVKIIGTEESIKQCLTVALEQSLAIINSEQINDREKIVNKIKDMINSDYKEITRIEQIASALYISSSYARRIYKQYTGQTIFEGLFLRRMEVAKKLLSNPDARTYEVAEAVGYKSKQHFIDVFKKYTGLLPKEYKYQNNGKE